jgi:hypothetical protein
MAKEDDYRSYAAETIDLASRANSTSDKGRLLAMAEAWLSPRAAAMCVGPSTAQRDMREHIEAQRRRIEDMVTRGIAFHNEEARAAFLQSVLRGNVPFYEPRERIFPVDRAEAEARGTAWLKLCLSPEQLAALPAALNKLVKKAVS